VQRRGARELAVALPGDALHLRADIAPLAVLHPEPSIVAVVRVEAVDRHSPTCSLSMPASPVPGKFQRGFYRGDAEVAEKRNPSGSTLLRALRVSAVQSSSCWGTDRN